MSGWSIYSQDSKIIQRWMSSLKFIQKQYPEILGQHVSLIDHEVSELILIDSKSKTWREWLSDQDRNGRSYILVLEEQESLPSPVDLELVDDLLVEPFRLADLFAKVKSHHERKMISDLQGALVESERTLIQSASTLESILEKKTPRRFHSIKGLKIMSRHLSGLKPGGDYFDVFESEKKDAVHFILSDASSYGLSSALLGALLSSSHRLAEGSGMPPEVWTEAIYKELTAHLKPSEHLSFLVGRLNRKDFSFHYQAYGSLAIYKVNQKGEFELLPKSGQRLSAESILSTEDFKQANQVVVLDPRDRLIFLTDGFIHGLGGDQKLRQVFEKKANEDPFHVVTELTFEIKARLKPGETFPGEDCSAIVVDVENRVLRLAPTG